MGHGNAAAGARCVGKLTVAVMSEEQISQMYLIPPSVVLTAVFFLMSPIAKRAWVLSRARRQCYCGDARGTDSERGVVIGVA